MADTYMPIHSICVLLSILDESDMDVRTIVGGGMKPELQLLAAYSPAMSHGFNLFPNSSRQASVVVAPCDGSICPPTECKDCLTSWMRSLTWM
jgi:hypothetical protein